MSRGDFDINPEYMQIDRHILPNPKYPFFVDAANPYVVSGTTEFWFNPETNHLSDERCPNCSMGALMVVGIGESARELELQVYCQLCDRASYFVITDNHQLFISGPNVRKYGCNIRAIFQKIEVIEHAAMTRFLSTPIEEFFRDLQDIRIEVNLHEGVWFNED